MSGPGRQSGRRRWVIIGLVVALVLAGLTVGGVFLFGALNRCGSPSSGDDLSGCDLTGRDLSGLDLTGADLSRAILTNTDLTGTTLVTADLGEADLTGARLESAVLDEADLSGADLAGATAAGASFVDATMPGAVLHGTDLQGASLSGADLSGADLGEAALSTADLSWASLTSASLVAADLTNADLTGADLTGATMTGATLTGASLSSTVGLTDAMLADAMGVPETGLAAAVLQQGLFFDTRDEVISAAPPVVTGLPVGGTRAYVTSPDFHPMVVLDAGGVPVTPDWASSVQDSWLPEALRFAELAAVAEEGSEVVEECTGYVNDAGDPVAPLVRQRHTVHVKVFALLSGQLVGEQVVTGSDPRACEFSESTALWDTGLWGDPIDYETQVLPWLADIVHAPAAG